MSRGPKRRTMVFVDYSGLRDTLRQNQWLINGSRDFEIDFEKLGILLCGPEREFIRLNLYTGTPVVVNEEADSFFMHGYKVHDHEAFVARKVQLAFQNLVRQVDNRSNYTSLYCGRMVLRRVTLKHGPAFEWAQKLFMALGSGQMDEETGSFFSKAKKLNFEAKNARDDLFKRIIEAKQKNIIPTDLMSEYSSRMSELIDEQLVFSEKGVDTKLTVSMMEHCMNDSFDDAILFAADEDYIPLVNAVKRTGRRVVHAFWDVRNIGWPLRRICDESILLGKNDALRLMVNSK